MQRYTHGFHSMFWQLLFIPYGCNTEYKERERFSEKGKQRSCYKGPIIHAEGFSFS